MLCQVLLIGKTSVEGGIWIIGNAERPGNLTVEPGEQQEPGRKPAEMSFPRDSAGREHTVKKQTKQ